MVMHQSYADAWEKLERLTLKPKNDDHAKMIGKAHSTPNIIYILADDMGYGDLSCLNPESRIKTTHLDRIAREGQCYTDAHSTSAVCTPSRYSILTGRYNWRSTLKEGVLFGYDGPLIEPERMTVASLLRQQGYTTACIGKWHLGWDWPLLSGGDREAIDFSKPIKNGPINMGFDRFFGICASLDMPPYVYIDQDRPTAIPDRSVLATEGKGFWRAGPTAPDFRHEEVMDRFIDESIRFMEQSTHDHKPFFIYLPLAAPHTPILPSARFQGQSGTNAYGDFCLEVDDAVGRIDAALERLGISDDTLIIFTSDNGCSPMADFKELAAHQHNPSYIFRGHKADIYEGGHRIPLVMRWPRVIPPGSVVDQTVCLSDLLATCAEISGVDLPNNAGEDSVSQLALMRGERVEHATREATVHHSINGSFSIRQAQWKLELCAGSGGWSFPRPGPECEGLPPMQLYNLEEDISERHNLIDEYPDVAERLTGLLNSYIEKGRSTPGDPVPNTGTPYWPQLWWIQKNQPHA